MKLLKAMGKIRGGRNKFYFLNNILTLNDKINVKMLSCTLECS